jgi:alkylhydroperoxidase/carboxymuconolactone decarboxylase family protein
MIFSSIPVAEEDKIPGLPPPAKPVLDHVGIDLRRETDDVRALFDGVPALAATAHWNHVPQGGPGKPVFCCHIEVAAKHWVYPPRAEATTGATFTRPVELAIGPLRINGVASGCDLRPIDPAHPAASQVPKCCGAAGDQSHDDDQSSHDDRSHYYDRSDLGRFGEIGAHAGPAAAKFFEWYGAATDAEGALTRREKALIGLAVAHVKQCPYCIDAYTGQCIERGATAAQMHEALHVAAAVSAGACLVHGTQMQNALRARGKL